MLAHADPAPAPAPARAHLLVVPRTPAGVVALARSDARVVASYGSFTLVSTADDGSLRAAGAERRDDMRAVATAAGDFDPLGRPSLAAKDAPDRDEALALVQFVGPPKDDWLARLRATGARLVTYQAQNAYVVHARAGAVERLAALVGTDPAVRAVVALGAADKVEGAAASPARYAVSTVARHGLRTRYAELSPAQVGELASRPAVVAIERDVAPVPADERADQIVAGNLVAPALTQPSPAGYLAWHNSKISAPLDATIDVTDSGLDNGASPTDHPDLHVLGSSVQPDRIAYRQNYTADANTHDCTGHGTSAASLAAGYNSSTGPSWEDTAGYNYGLGVAPLAGIGVSKIFDCGGVAASFSASTVASNAYAGGARIQSNSWGVGGTDDWGTYGSRAREYDALVRDAQPGTAGNQEMVEVFSAGNDGGRGQGTMASEASAKNVISVGASEGVRASGTDGCGIANAGADNAREIAPFSGRGPTNDGRMKPDLVAPGTHMTAARPNSSYTGIGTCNPFFVSTYSLASGTSQAAPLVSGAAALARDWYEDTQGATPSPALTKALLINTATDLAGGPNDEQGWGRLNVGAALDSTARGYYDQLPGDVLTSPGQTAVRSFTVPDTSKPVKVTLAWTDAPGSPMSDDAFVNDLDLEVANGGRAYKGNVFAGAWSRTGGSNDPRDNVESVYLPAGTSGRFSVTVRATTLGGDGLPGSGDSTDQDFALVVSNATQTSTPVLVHNATTISGGDGDGVLESDETVGLTEQLRNAGTADATGLSGTLTGAGGLTVTQGGSAYPTILDDNGVGSNSTSFTAHLANAAVCGGEAAATLTISGGSVGSQSVPVVLPTGAPGPLQINSSAQVPVAIPDDSTVGASSSVFIAERGRIKDLNVTLPSPGIVHPADGDLVIDLIGPDGTTVRLADHPGGPNNPGANFSGTIFDDEASQNVSQGSAPYTGNFRPQNDQLSRFDGKSRYGTWTLRVRDLFAGDTGTLRAWGVASQKASCNVDRTPPDTVIGAFPNSSTRATTATFSIGSADPGASFECRLDAGAWAPCGKTVSYSGLAPATHAFSARAIDGSDNEDPTPATYTWKVLEPASTAAASFVLAPAEERTATAMAGHYRVLAACAAACRVGAKLTLGKTALGHGAARRRAAGTSTVLVKLGKRGRAALRHRGSARVKLTITLTQGRSKLTVKRTVALRRGAGLRRIAAHGLRYVAAVTRASRLSGKLTVGAAQARKIGLAAKGRKRVTVASARINATRAPRLLVLRAGGKPRKALAGAKRVAALLEAVAGKTGQARRTAKLGKTLVR